MKTLIIILLFIGLYQSSWACCAEDDRTLTEKLFQGNVGTIFTCKVLTFTTPTYPDNMIVPRSDGKIDGTATAEIVTVYFGKVDTNIVTLNTDSYMSVGKTYLIYTGDSGRIFSFGGICDRWSKKISDNLEPTSELLILSQFSYILKNKDSGRFTFSNSKNIVVAKGKFKKGKAIKIWQHFYNNGTLKSEYDFKKNITSLYSANGFIKSKSTVNGNTAYHEKFSEKVNGQLTFTDREVKNDTGLVMYVSEYYDNGNIKRISSQVNIRSKDGGSYSTGKSGEYKEYYENGNLKLHGNYKTGKRIGLWKWYHENGDFNTEFDYKDGVNEMENTDNKL